MLNWIQFLPTVAMMPTTRTTPSTGAEAISGTRATFAFTPNSTNRVALKDTGSQLIITVSYLVKEDTGWYWCGIQQDFARDVMDFTQLIVTDSRDGRVSGFPSGKETGKRWLEGNKCSLRQ